MSAKDIVRAWKSEDYLATLSPAEISALPENPAGNIELRRHKHPQVSITPPHCSVVIECSASNCA
jgi:mersacidin/lichenicidin family type 2 lantibiotic